MCAWLRAARTSRYSYFTSTNTLAEGPVRGEYQISSQNEQLEKLPFKWRAYGKVI